ncbi:phosphonate C-P lyase system protein PhnH [Aureimonas mangrovi]|uniref:phosphonate C-P lyase system protein PhnH n=1 Tax=Aureimonas mangrovi TaxID=2758041 RepID=UPI00163D49DA|nr:phosphonate C-P lyase system protein PhnH [Aureimonas mangrovi]
MGSPMQTAVVGGLEDPVFGSQAIFRQVMNAFAAPGTIADLGDLVQAPEGVVPAAAAVLAALADQDTPVWVAQTGATVGAWVAFQTGAEVTDEPRHAVFALLPAGMTVDDWAEFPIGTAQYPDRGATLILPVEAFEGGSELQLTGPGIQTVRSIAPRGLPAGFVAARAADRERFPLGHDHLLVCGTRVMALPRTTRIQEV